MQPGEVKCTTKLVPHSHITINIIKIIYESEIKQGGCTVQPAHALQVFTRPSLMSKTSNYQCTNSYLRIANIDIAKISNILKIKILGIKKH